MNKRDKLKLTGKEKAYTLPEEQKILVDLTLGYRKPQNDYERRLLADIEAAKKAGYTIEIPNE